MDNRTEFIKILKSSKRQFHRHNAKIYLYVYEDNFRQMEFWSYSTPIVVKKGDEVFVNNNWYSQTTTRQTNRFCREYGIDKDRATKIGEYEMRAMCV